MGLLEEEFEIISAGQTVRIGIDIYTHCWECGKSTVNADGRGGMCPECYDKWMKELLIEISECKKL